MNTRVALALLGLFLSVPSALRAAAKDATQPLNVLLIVTDDQRPDTIAALGNERIKTPHLDRLVREGTAFTRAVAANPICTPSRAELISGTTGFRNGVLYFGQRIDPSLTLWPQAMQAAGYDTWLVGKWDIPGTPRALGYTATAGLYMGGSGLPETEPADFAGRPVTGYRGWAFRDEAGKVLPDEGVGLTGDISRKFADAAIGVIERKSERPFFLHVTFTAPHDPLHIPPGYEERAKPERAKLPGNFMAKHPFDHGNFDGRDEQLFAWPRTPEMVRAELACYYAVIEDLDAQIGRMLDALDKTGLADRTLVIFTSDHGLAIGSHGLRGKQNMYEHTIGVPLVIRGPHIRAGRRVAAQCYLRDLYPTICELAGVAVPESVEARSLLPAIKGEAQEIHPFTVAYFRDVQRMIRTDRWKLICYPKIGRTQLFDLAADPLELDDLAAERRYQATVSELRSKLAAWQQEHRDPVELPAK
ncbi:MAG TPA: sulfatase-like hydrolase/transferase [Pirellulales bacterium]|nr:sulfatase-like hydrolase/transferase [Pirellulales bacterium]